MKRLSLDLYDEIPHEMRTYLKHNGWHFNRKACDYAVGLMKRKNASNGKVEKVEKLTKDAVDAMLTKHGVSIENTDDYDYVYVANKFKATLFKSGIADEQQLAMAIKSVVDDELSGDGEIMRKWDAEMTSRGIPIDWEELL
jgi:hypothetical protein